MIIGSIYYFAVQAKKGPEVLAEHRADVPDRAAALGEVAP